jgi:hypothetical protein
LNVIAPSTNYGAFTSRFGDSVSAKSDQSIEDAANHEQVHMRDGEEPKAMTISDDVAALIRECEDKVRTLVQKCAVAETTRDWENYLVDHIGAILTANAAWMKTGVTPDESTQLEDNGTMWEDWEDAGITPEQVKEFHALQIRDATIVDFFEDPKSVLVRDVIES